MELALPYTAAVGGERWAPASQRCRKLTLGAQSSASALSNVPRRQAAGVSPTMRRKDAGEMRLVREAGRDRDLGQ